MTDTNKKIAELLFEQTYDERMEMARFFSDTVQDCTEENIVIDESYFVSWLDDFAEGKTG